MKNPKHIMRKLLYSSLFAVAFAFANPLFATHIVGGELGYKYLGNDTFLITLDLYRDYCGENAAALDLYSFIDIFRDNGQQWPGIPKEAKSLKFISKDTVPNNIAGDPCLFVPNDVCIEHSRWEGKVRIVGSGGFYIVYQRCCRNANIVNILAPDDVGTTYWLYVSPLARSLNNNSPEFGFYPPVYVCVNYPIAHPHAGTDVDGDDLVYKLYTPYLGAYPDSSQPQPFPAPAGVGNILPPPFDTVVWNSPNFSLSQVLGPSPDPLRFDPVTGLITGLPQIQGRFVIGLLVEEYRNGQLLSVVRRDFQYDVGQCAELDVQIEAPDAQCDDLTVHFENFTDVAQNFIWYFDWPNPTPFSTQKEPTFTFPDTGTYVVALVAEPVGACVDTAFHTIYLQNNSLTPDFSWQTYDCTSQSVLVLTDLSTDPVSPVDTWAWTVVYGSTTLTSNLQNPVFQIPNTASGTITLTASSVNGCEQTKTVSFAAGGNNPTDDIDPIAPFCLGSPVSLNPTGAVPGFTYQWSAPVPPAQQTLANPTVMLTQNTTFTVTITGFGGLCQSTVQVLAQVFQPVQLAFSPDTDCDATIVHFVNQSQNAPSGFVWNFGDPSTNADVSMEANPTWDYPAFGSYTVTLMTAPNAVCKDTIQQSILLEQKTLEAAFSFGYTGCEEGGVSVQFFDETENSEDDTNGWLWTFSGAYTGTSTQMNPSVMVSQEGWLYVTFQATTSEGCTDATALDSLWIDLTELPNLDPGGTTVQACLNGGATLNPGGDTTYIYAWSPSTGLSCANCPSPLANPSQSTVYTVLIQNPNGADTCAITRQVNVTVPTNVNLVSSADVESCNDSTTIFTSVGLLPVTFAWFNDSGAQVAGNVPTLTVPISGYAYYVVRATDPLGCHYYDTTNVVGGPVNIEAVGDQIKCSDEPLTIFATNLDQNDTLAWQWAADPIFNGPTNVPNPTVSNLPGDRWLYVTATNQFGCSATDSVYVAVVDTSNMLGFEFVAACNGSTVQFVNTSTNAFNFSWNFGDPTATDDISFADNPVYNYPGPGTYPVRLTMDFDLACVDTLQQNVVIESTQFIPDFTFEYVACETDSVDVQFHDATTILQVGITIDSFFWTSSNGDTSTLASPIFTVYEGQDFEVTMTIFTSNGCDGTVTKELKLEFIEVNFSDSLVLCPGDSTELNPTGDISYVYNWTPNTAISDPTAANPTVWPSQTTTYFVEITSLSPDTCSITRTVTVFVPEKLDVTAPSDTLTCGAPVTLCASANLQPVEYQWFALPGGFVGGDDCLSILPSTDTEYELVGTDQYGCQDRDTVFVADESVMVAWQPAGAECPETEIQVSVINLDDSHTLDFDWSVFGAGQIVPPATGQTATIVTPPASLGANYTVVATNQFGCTASLTQSIVSYNFVPTVVDSVGVCPSVPTNINNGANPNLNYVWSPSTGLSCSTCPSPVVTITQPTTYTATVSGTYGLDQCSEVIEVEVFSAPVIDITETVDTFTCGEPIVIAAQTNVPVVSYSWTNSAGTPLGGQPSLSVDPVDEDVYMVLVTDSFGCFESDTVAVSNSQLDIELTGGGVIDTCPMPNYNICIINLDMADMLMYEWSASNGGTILGGGDTACPEVTSEQGVTSVFEVVVTNQWGCSSTEQFDITTFTFNPMVREAVVICPNVPTPLNPEAAGSDLNYFWTPSTGLSCTNCPNPSATLPGGQTQLYQVVVEGYNGADTCSFTQTVQVQVMPEHEQITTPATDTVLCDSVDVLLSVAYSSPFVNAVAWSQTLNFSNPFATTNSVTVTPDGTENYYVLTTDTLGCRDTSHIVIYAYPVDVTVPDILSFCEEIGELTIPVINHHPDQSMTYTWTPTEHIETQNPDGSIVITDLPMDETYFLDASNQYGCHELDTTEVFYYDIESTLDSITASEDTILYGSGEFSQLGINEWPGYTYQWSPEAGLDDPTIPNPIATPEETTTYTVLVTDEGGCQASRSVTIVVLNPDCDEPNLFLPNAFTPNGDGENDVFWLRSNIISEMELAIFNRWGQRVFYTEDQDTKWNGAMNNDGDILSPDVYGFYLRAKCFNGQEYFKKGNVTLLR